MSERRDPDEDLPMHEDEPPADEDGSNPNEDEEGGRGAPCISQSIQNASPAARSAMGRASYLPKQLAALD